MKSWLRLAILASLGVVLACSGPSSEAQEDETTDVEETVAREVERAGDDAEPTDDVPPGAPRVAERYQRSINRGWEKAVEGETPAYACAGLKGRVIGTGTAAEPEALEALFACNVLLPVRYFETLLDSVEAGERSCTDFLREMSTQLPAMTLSVDDVEGMMAAFEEDGSGEVDREAMGEALADAATMERGLEAPGPLIKERLADRVREVCPDLADALLR